MFHTNLKKVHGPYGGGKESNFTRFQSSVGKIIGFLGKTSSVVDSLRVFMSHDLRWRSIFRFFLDIGSTDDDLGKLVI